MMERHAENSMIKTEQAVELVLIDSKDDVDCDYSVTDIQIESEYKTQFFESFDVQARFVQSVAFKGR
uniref:Uncharacterized protein n=1 Tax=Arion vulgaris TaxID=1028688 RepID=A0A0B6ZR18_9EUPU